MLLAEVKAILGISATTDDARITALIPIIEDEVKTICNDTFEDGFPAGVQGVIADMILHRIRFPVGLKSSSLGDASETYQETFPTAFIDRLPKRAKFV
jgi:hypothetical protein